MEKKRFTNLGRRLLNENFLQTAGVGVTGIGISNFIPVGWTNHELGAIEIGVGGAIFGTPYVRELFTSDNRVSRFMGRAKEKVVFVAKRR
ncbi:MAG: hypothetical protein M1268_01315 [Patescibacteria group bacterium]|nr:hypothetical protein [Patescibacteria group bacterium]